MPSAKVDLYNHAYGSFADEIYRAIRVETYGVDLGQTSWVNTRESDEIPRLLNLTSSSSVLEIGSGSGAYALYLARTLGCSLIGVDINELGIQNANRLAEQSGLAVRFQQCDASRPLPFPDAQFDSVFSNDVICHIPGRENLLREVFRVLKPGGRFLFSDALVIGGIISADEVATRSAIGYYLFSPPGENEKIIAAAGFRLLQVTDTTQNAAEISGRRHKARDSRRQQVVEIEGEGNFEGLQKFWSCVHQLTSERRLLRYLYLAEKP